MSLLLVVRPEAEQDLAAARDWYDAQREGLGEEFMTAVDRVFSHILEFPESYAVEYKTVRRSGLQRFPYVVYYRLTGASVEVLAVLHGSRHPRTWQSRA